MCLWILQESWLTFLKNMGKKGLQKNKEGKLLALMKEEGNHRLNWNIIEKVCMPCFSEVLWCHSLADSEPFQRHFFCSMPSKSEWEYFLYVPMADPEQLHHEIHSTEQLFLLREKRQIWPLSHNNPVSSNTANCGRTSRRRLHSASVVLFCPVCLLTQEGRCTLHTPFWSCHLLQRERVSSVGRLPSVALYQSGVLLGRVRQPLQIRQWMTPFNSQNTALCKWAEMLASQKTLRVWCRLHVKNMLQWKRQ